MFSDINYFRISTKERDSACKVDQVAHEKDIAIYVNRSYYTSLRATLNDTKELAIGHLFFHGVVKSHDNIEHIENEDKAIVKVELKPSSSFQNNVLEYIDVNWTVSADAIYGGIALLQEAPLYRKTGAFHVAILMHHTGYKYFLLEDIARHNVIEKAIGKAILEGIKREEYMLLFSGRLMHELVRKILIAKIPIIGGISATTCEAIDLAQKYGATLIGFIREGRMNVYTHPARIIEFFQC